MASELLKNRALIQRLKEPEVPVVKFNLGDTGFEELITLPEPKPQELLDIQEDVRIQRQQDTMDKARPFLMDESVDFIERENFKYGTFGNIKYVSEKRLPYRATFELKPGESFELDGRTFTSTGLSPEGRPRRASKLFATEKEAQDFLNKVEKKLLDGKTILTAKDLTKKFREYKKKYPDRLLDQEFTDLINKEHVDTYRSPFSTDQIRQEVNRISGGKLKGAGVSFEKLPKLKQNELINRFPEIYKKGYDFNTHRLGVPVSQAGNLYNEIYNTALDFSKRWPSGGDNNKNKIWHAAYRSVVTGENLNKPKYKLFDIKKNRTLTPREIEKTNWAKKFKEAVFLDTETGKKFSYDGKVKGTTSLENYINKFSVPGNPDSNRFNNAINKYKVTQKIRAIKITTPDGKKMTLGGYLDNQTRPAWMKKGTPFGFINNHHVFDITKNFWDTEPVLYKDNRNLNYFERPARDALIKAADLPEKEQAKILKPFVKKFKQLGPIQMKEGKLNLGEYDFNKVVTQALDESGLDPSVIKNIKQKELTALQQLASGKNVGFDPILATRAGFEEFVKPAAKIGARGAATIADLALSAGAGPIGLGVGALIETGQAMPELTRGNIKEAGRRTIIGSLLPESLVGSMRGDLLQLAETPEEKIAMQNFIDFEKDREKYESRVKNLRYLEENPFEAEGIDLSTLQNKVLEQRADLQERAPKVFFKEFAQEILPTLVRRLDAQNVENLEGVLGSIVGRREIDDRDDIIQDIGKQVVTEEEPFYGQAPVQLSPEELDEIYESGIMAMANGGRIGFADGPDDPSKRTFMKIMAGIASLPILGKFFKSANVAKKVVPLTNTTTTMPKWFPQFVEKALAKGVQTKIDADLMEVKIPELPDVKMEVRTDGKVFVEGKNAYNEPYQIEYEPPGYEVLDYETGKTVKTKGDFTASDTEYRMVGEDDYDVDGVVLNDVDEVLGGSATKLEGFAKGTGEEKYTIGQKRIDEAEALGERADENIPYRDVDPTDFADE